MKWFPLFFLVIFGSCEERVPSYKKIEAPQEEQIILQASRLKSRQTFHMDPRVKIDTERQEIELIDKSGELCGIGFKEGQVLPYQLISDNDLEIQLESETLKLHRIHQFDSTSVYGEWRTGGFGEPFSETRERIVTFIVSDQEKMAVEVYCEERTIP